MKRSVILATLLAVVLVLVAATAALGANGEPNDGAPKPGTGGGGDPNVGKVWEKATPNLSFPVIMTDVIQTFFQQYPVYDDVDDEYSWYVSYDPDTGLPLPIAVVASLTHDYGGTFPGTDEETYDYYTLLEGCPTDISGPDDVPDGIIDDYDLTKIPMATFFTTNNDWSDQPVYMSDETVTNDYTLPDGTVVTYSGPAYGDPNLIWNAEYIDTTESGGDNAWQADWKYVGGLGTITVDDYGVTTDPTPVVQEDLIQVDFIDWGNPLENTVAPIVGQRFPVEVALYEQVAADHGEEVWGEFMTVYKMACIEYPGTAEELFGNGTYNYDGSSGSENTFEGAFATVLTNKFYAEVWDPSGGIVKIPVEPGIGPSGKMNFASAGGGWIPTMSGWHRIWLHVTDPLISLTWAEVNNDEHYIMSSGCKAQDLNANKQGLVGIIGDSTYIDVFVQPSTGKKIK